MGRDGRSHDLIPGDTIVAVCGLARSGAALVMQMLQAGGAEASGLYPSFDPTFDANGFETSWSADRHAFMDENVGLAVKVLGVAAIEAMPRRQYRCLWVGRDHQQQAASMLKFQSATQPGFTGSNRATRNALATHLRRTEAKAIVKLRSRWSDVLLWKFERIIEDPRVSAQAFAEYLQLPLDVDLMAGAVIDRRPECLTGFLEPELMLAKTYNPSVLSIGLRP
jgi:hypothetical protein